MPQLEYPTSEHELPPDATFRILLIDAESQVERLKAVCKDVGYVVAGASTLVAGTRFLEGRHHVDVIVCSAHLDGESAFEFLEFVRKHEGSEHTKFLFLSLEPTARGAFLDKSGARAGMALGADGYLVMPHFDEQALLTELRKLHPVHPALEDADIPGLPWQAEQGAPGKSVVSWG